MITAEVKYDENGKYESFECFGHANYSEPGSDIICASVSMLVINTANCIEAFSDCEFEAKAGDRITYRFKSVPDIKAEVLMDALIFGLNDIQKKHKKNLKLIVR